MEPTRTIAPLFTWRSAIAESDLAPTTRHVLLTLSTYMNERGGSAYPGSARLARDSGLHQDTVKHHLKQAAELGWIRVIVAGGSIPGGKRLATEYVASVPGVVDPRFDADRGFSSADRGSSSVRPGVHGPPITSVNTPENSRISRFVGKPEPDCIRCHGRGMLYSAAAGTEMVCSCADTRPHVGINA